RRDEIGHLSGSLREMTNALYSRIEAIESFAADVAHELKNPLTSLRSAVETLPLARSDESRGRLLSVIDHDVKRLDRLISIIVDDDGPGVRPEALDKIFERFYTDRPHQGFGQNSGLGLSISKQIVAAHDGSLAVENRIGAATGGWPPKVLGARFIVRLPAM